MKKQVGNRLKLALERRERSIRSFQRALHDQRIHGSSYASVYQYVQGRTSPPLEFLEGAAKELAVRVSWLVSGEGLMGVEDKERHFGEELADLIVQRHPWLGAMPRWNLHQFRDVVLQYQLQVSVFRRWNDKAPGIRRGLFPCRVKASLKTWRGRNPC